MALCAAWQGGLSGGICVCLGAYVFKRAFVWLSRIILPAVRMLLGEGEGLYERQKLGIRSFTSNNHYHGNMGGCL